MKRMPLQRSEKSIDVNDSSDNNIITAAKTNKELC